ncbi:MAG: hypothetical protein ABSG33_05170 [Candidatus Bathyarchaeia archaeon]|jgi:hypothetical protein
MGLLARLVQQEAAGCCLQSLSPLEPRPNTQRRAERSHDFSANQPCASESHAAKPAHSKNQKVATFTNLVSASPTGAQANINFWLLNGLSPADGNSVAVVIKSFNFTPRNLALFSSDSLKSEKDEFIGSPSHYCSIRGWNG